VSVQPLRPADEIVIPQIKTPVPAEGHAVAETFKDVALLQFGRIPTIDTRDTLFPARAALPSSLRRPVASQIARERGYRYWDMDTSLDQIGPSCVEYAGRTALISGPVKNVDLSMHPELSIYDWMQRNDEWPGEAYDGTSARAFAKWAQQNGYIESYHWEFGDIQVIVDWLFDVGPVLLGTVFPDSMCFPAIDNKLKVPVMPVEDGPNLGAHASGHEYCANGVNKKKGLLRIQNTWGTAWGDKGVAWLRISDAARLLQAGGDALMFREIKKKRVVTTPV
jgi:hypothetical protein